MAFYEKKTCRRVLAVLLLFIPSVLFVLPQKEISDAERRLLARRPGISFQGIRDHSFMDGVESAMQDQFPGRQVLRTLKAIVDNTAFGRSEVHGYAYLRGTLTKLPPENEAARAKQGAEKVIDLLKPLFPEGHHRFFAALIPDKNVYLSAYEKNMFPDYGALWRGLSCSRSDVRWIDLRPALALDDFYRTDHHWKQERLDNAVSTIVSEMGFEKRPVSWEKTEFSGNFFGAYYGQAALPIGGDILYYCHSDVTDRADVKHLEEGKSNSVYDFEKGQGRDPYDLFLSGGSALVTIKNPLAGNHRELVMFRDSFGSSIAPLLLPYYEKITLVDLRYIKSDKLPRYIDMSSDADVLMLLSLPVLANSAALR